VIARLVEFEGVRYWLTAGGALAPREHCDPHGNISELTVFLFSFAHLFEDGAIKRYGAVVGTRDDFRAGLDA
jgi:hypothetical protein